MNQMFVRSVTRLTALVCLLGFMTIACASRPSATISYSVKDFEGNIIEAKERVMKTALADYVVGDPFSLHFVSAEGTCEGLLKGFEDIKASDRVDLSMPVYKPKVEGGPFTTSQITVFVVKDGRRQGFALADDISLNITKFDKEKGGRIEGTFKAKNAKKDWSAEGKFIAKVCR